MFKVMFYGGLILAVICLILSIILFVKNDVAKLIADITGWNTKTAGRKKNNEKDAQSSQKREKNPIQKLKEFFQNFKMEETTVLTDNIVKRDENSKSVKSKNQEDIQKTATKEQVENIFQAEEDMVVLAGEKENPQTRSSKAGTDASDGELAEMLKSRPIRLSRRNTMVEMDDILSDKEKKPATKKSKLVLKKQFTDVLGEDEILTDILENNDTDILRPSAKQNSRSRASTDILRNDHATNVLPKDRATDVLPDNHATDILQKGIKSPLPAVSETLFENFDEEEDYEENENTDEDITDVLTSDEYAEDDYEDMETTEVLTSNSENSTDVLRSDEKNVNYEEQPLPDIFDVQDTATIVHTEDTI